MTKSRITPEILKIVVQKRAEGVEFKEIAKQLNAEFLSPGSRPFTHALLSNAIYRRAAKPTILPFRREVVEFLRPHYWSGEKTMAQLAIMLQAQFPECIYTAASVRDGAGRHGLERNPELLSIGTAPVRSAITRAGAGSWAEAVALSRLDTPARPVDNLLRRVPAGTHPSPPGGFSMLRPRQPDAGAAQAVGWPYAPWPAA
tara:strand:- start:1125 stop:1727 length:603 start_codon:yes stop_codon:yes gene_type:complete